MDAPAHPRTDRRAQGPRKKRISDALEALAHGRVTHYERLNDLTIARIINKEHGGPVITAMEVGQLDDAWIDLFLGVAFDLPEIRKRQQWIQDKFKEFEREQGYLQ